MPPPDEECTQQHSTTGAAAPSGEPRGAAASEQHSLHVRDGATQSRGVDQPQPPRNSGVRDASVAATANNPHSDEILRDEHRPQHEDAALNERAANGGAGWSGWLRRLRFSSVAATVAGGAWMLGWVLRHAGRVSEDKSSGASTATGHSSAAEGLMFVALVAGGSLLTVSVLRGLMFLQRAMIDSAEQHQARSRRQHEQRRARASLTERLIARRIAAIPDREQREYARAAHRLMTLDRDFNDADYEMLLELDNNNQRLQRFLEGAPQSVIDTLPTFFHVKRADADSAEGRSGHDDAFARCPICLEDYEHGDMLRLLPCFHKFHTTCVDTALQQKAMCPICKAGIQEQIADAQLAIAQLNG
eukprot:CAMPEP_0185837168 /NCGR_PEP_ID=MMETSP1353-20130828/10926_1 /TAXON_ID=1077150 /ORGANISM="Erythrolobus australicus, Strain CCMP3124" /LENGTH=359 /DNA_ID=CAMNT_0028536047 /DNA_START=40 /DNA_END=1119 /DNA_ORIENTATION=+